MRPNIRSKVSSDVGPGAMTKPRVLLQLDGDAQPSVFDGVVAVDAGVDHLFRHGSVTPAGVRDLVHGAMFTRGGADLASTAIFVGGHDVARAQALLQAVLDCFFGPVRVSVMLDANGANTTAAAAVLAVESHVELAATTLLVLGATGPVGQRVVRLASRRGAQVRVGSRSAQRAQEVCDDVRRHDSEARLAPIAVDRPDGLAAALAEVQVVIAAGAAGVRVVSDAAWREAAELRVAVDLNAVPPAGIEPIEVTDVAAERDGVVCYGAIGVGGAKMKIHKRAIRRLFEVNDQVLDAEAIYELGRQTLAD